MLGSYIKHSMYLPLKFTLESLVDLCLAEFMNPESLLKVIDKTILDIHHPSVISRYGFIYLSKTQLKHDVYFFILYSYCNLLMVLCNQTTENEKRREFFQNLWSLVLHSNDNTVKCALK